MQCGFEGTVGREVRDAESKTTRADNAQRRKRSGVTRRPPVVGRQTKPEGAAGQEKRAARDASHSDKLAGVVFRARCSEPNLFDVVAHGRGWKSRGARGVVVVGESVE